VWESKVKTSSFVKRLEVGNNIRSYKNRIFGKQKIADINRDYSQHINSRLLIIVNVRMTRNLKGFTHAKKYFLLICSKILITSTKFHSYSLKFHSLSKKVIYIQQIFIDIQKIFNHIQQIFNHCKCQFNFMFYLFNCLCSRDVFMFVSFA